MSGFKEPDFPKRQEATAIAKKAALEKFRAKAADPALADRLTERTARAADRKAIKNARAAEKAETKSRETERAQQAELEAALQAERVAETGSTSVLSCFQQTRPAAPFSWPLARA